MRGRTFISGLKIVLAGMELALEDVRDMRVEQHLFLPDAFSFRLADPLLRYVDDARFAPGKEVEISASGSERPALVPLIKGKIVAVEPEFGRGEAALTVRGYDLSHGLHGVPQTRAFQDMTVGAIVNKVVREAGVRLRTVAAPGTSIDFVQQSNETDWRFLWRLAADVDMVLTVVGDTLRFQKPGAAVPGPAVALTWGEQLTELRPRVSAADQANTVKVQSWDPLTARAVSATARVDAADGKIPLSRAAAAQGVRRVPRTIVGRPASTMREARALATATGTRLGNAYLEADGVADGDPRIRAGSRLTVDGVGRRFGGTYLVTSTEHVYRGGRGYETRFAVSGRSPRTLLDLLDTAQPPPWTAGLVVGVVTNNNDPMQLGRVRVRYPALSATIEGWWARIAAPSAGASRGVLMMPVAGDEVVVGFEHGDPRRPYVLGAVFNGRAKPGVLAHPDGSLHARSDKEILLESTGNMTVDTKGQLDVTAVGPLTIEGKAVTTVKAGGVMTVEAQGAMMVKAQGVTTVEAQGAMTIKAAVMTVEAQAAMSIKAAGALAIESNGIIRVSAPQIMLG